ncbi:MAG: hypothetical protein ACREA9_21125 [Pyrinomonadaceae bacterium]
MSDVKAGPIEVNIDTWKYSASNKRFNEFVSDALRAAGVPMANSFHIRPSSGTLTRLPDDLEAPRFMRFRWTE